MPTIDVVRINEIRKHVADVIEQVHLGVDDARKAGRQAELPAKLDFTMNVIVEWQVLEVQKSDSGTTQETGGTKEKGSSKETTKSSDNGKSTEKQGGYQTEVSKGTSHDTQNGTDTKKTEGKNSHTQNTDQVTDTYES
jgi:hypothetical protein